MSDTCSDCKGRTTIIDPISLEEEPYTCPSCGGSGKGEPTAFWCMVCNFETTDEAESDQHDCMKPEKP